MPGRSSIRELQKYYYSIFGDRCTLDHIIPKSRNGPHKEFNLFPFDKNRHQAWHALFWNMTVFEVWERLGEIHNLIFNSPTSRIRPVWFDVCKLEKGGVNKRLAFKGLKIKVIANPTDVNVLKKNWLCCFKSTKLDDAVNFVAYKMLFIIFGRKVAEMALPENNEDFSGMMRNIIPVDVRALEYLGVLDIRLLERTANELTRRFA